MEEAAAVERRPAGRFARLSPPGRFLSYDAAAGDAELNMMRRALLLLLAALPGCLFSAPRYKGPASDHFDGREFFNEPRNPNGVGELLRWMTHRERAPWPSWIDAEPGPPPPKRVEGGDLRVTFINHATVLIQMDGLNILTDPIWSTRASPVPFAGPKRRRGPGLRFEDLPPIDVVLISHNHYDHLDMPTLRRLEARFAPTILFGLGNSALLAAKGLSGGYDLDWWQRVTLPGGVKITFVPSKHFSTRGAADSDATLWGSFVIEGAAGKVYFAGDTAFGPHFEEIAKTFGAFRLAVLPIGAFRPRWFMKHVHVSPEEAVAAQEILGAETAVGMHFGTFPLADDGPDEPIDELKKALAARPRPLSFWVLGFGEGRDVP
jgi:L-ascorbate metabolism protein UlaG (beta-lactamase superfamily)